MTIIPLDIRWNQGIGMSVSYWSNRWSNCFSVLMISLVRELTADGSWSMEFTSVSWRYRKGKDVSRILPASHNVGDHGIPFLAHPLSQSNRQRGALWTPRWVENSLEDMFTASRTTILPLSILFKGLFGKSGAMGQAHPSWILLLQILLS